MNTHHDKKTDAWTPNELKEFQARLLRTKRWLDAFPGPLGSPCLLRRTGPESGLDIEALPWTGLAVVGRNGDAPFAFPEDGHLSGRHFRLLAGPDGTCYAEDLNSTNGLWVNGRRIAQRRLMHGDEIRASQQVFVFHDGKGR